MITYEQAVSGLKKLVGEEKVLCDIESRKAGEGFNRMYAKTFDVWSNPLPYAIVYPDSVEEVSEVMRYCNANGLYVIPRTGGSSSEGHMEVREENTIILDGSHMNKLISIDPENMMATAQCGFPLEELEIRANKQGLTTGHSPQSRPMIQMGGVVATRSIGQFSTYYGGIEDMVCGLEAVMPDGRIVRIRPVCRRSAGPDMRHLFIGNEGALAFITEVTVKLFPYYPEDMWMGGYVVPSMKEGFEAIREIITTGYKPSVVRLYDKEDYDSSFGGVQLEEGEAYMFFTAEGPKDIAAVTGAAIHSISEKHGGRYIGTKPIEYWLEHRNDVCNGFFDTSKARREYKETNVCFHTTEIAASWSEIYQVYLDVMENVPKKIDNLVQIGGHVSHSYLNGTNIYFIYRLKYHSPETSNAEHTAAVHAICDEVIKYPNGTVVHHHGLGKQRVNYGPQEHGSSMCLLRDIKHMMDPNSIMNPGSLIQKYDE